MTAQHSDHRSGHFEQLSEHFQFQRVEGVQEIRQVLAEAEQVPRTLGYYEHFFGVVGKYLGLTAAQVRGVRLRATSRQVQMRFDLVEGAVTDPVSKLAETEALTASHPFVVWAISNPPRYTGYLAPRLGKPAAFDRKQGYSLILRNASVWHDSLLHYVLGFLAEREPQRHTDLGAMPPGAWSIIRRSDVTGPLLYLAKPVEPPTFEFFDD